MKPHSREKTARAFEKQGFDFEQCMNVLAEVNDDLTQAAIKLSIMQQAAQRAAAAAAAAGHPQVMAPAAPVAPAAPQAGPTPTRVPAQGLPTPAPAIVSASKPGPMPVQAHAMAAPQSPKPERPLVGSPRAAPAVPAPSAGVPTPAKPASAAAVPTPAKHSLPVAIKTKHHSHVPAFIASPVQQSKSALQAFSDAIEAVVEAHNNGTTDGSGFAVTKTQLQRVYSALQDLAPYNMIRQVPVDEITGLMTVLTEIIEAGATADLPFLKTGSDEPDEAYTLVLLSLEAAIVVVAIAAAPGLNQMLLSESLLRQCCACIKRHLTEHVFCVIEANTAPVDSAKFRALAPETAEVVKSLIGVCAGAVEQVAGLLKVMSLEESMILPLCDSCIKSFTVLGCDMIHTLQDRAMSFLQTVFAKYKQHQPALVRDVFGILLHVASGKRRARQWRLRDGTHIQITTALILQLLQAAALPAKPLDDDAGAAGAPTKPQQAAADPYALLLQGSMAAASQYLTLFVDRCASKDNGAEYRAAFKTFIDDVVVLVEHLEWPVVSTVLTITVRVLSRCLPGAVNPVPQYVDNASLVSLAINTLGQVLAKARECIAYAREHSLQLPKVKVTYNPVGRPEDADEDAQCFCKRGPGSSFMLDCDDCHRWFHGDCVGVLPRADQYASHFFWLCEDCRIRRQADLQQERMAQACRALGVASDSDMFSQPRYVPVVFQQLIINQLTSEARDVSDTAAFYARTWLLTSLAQAAHADGDKIVCRIYAEQWQIPAAQSASVDPVLNSKAIPRTCKNLFASSAFSKQFSRYIVLLFAVLSSSAPKVRASALKALAAIVETDPTLIASEDVQAVVQAKFDDESISVREAAVEMAGKYVAGQPALAQAYLDAFLSRLSDVGVSVRKRIAHLLRELLFSGVLDVDADANVVPATESLSAGRRAVLHQCAQRLSNPQENESVKQIITEMFTDLWFGNKRPDEAKSMACAIEMITLTTSRLQTTVSDEWLCALLRHVAAPSANASGSAAGPALAKSMTVPIANTTLQTALPEALRLKFVAIVKAVAAKLLQFVSSVAEASDEQMEDLSWQIISCVGVMRMFATVSAQLMVPHIKTLLPMLKGTSGLSAPCYRVLQHQLLPLLTLSMPHLANFDATSVNAIATEMAELIRSAPAGTIIKGAIECACALVEHVSHDPLPLLDIMADNCAFLQDARAATDPTNVATIERCSFVVGLLCKHLNFDDPQYLPLAKQLADVHQTPVPGSVNKTVYKLLLAFVDHPTPRVQAKALQSLGYVFAQQPRLMLQKSSSQALSKGLRHDMPVVRAKLLSTFRDLLRAEEGREASKQEAAALRQKSAAGKKSNADVLGDLDPDASIMTGVVQSHHKQLTLMLRDDEAEVRLEALKLLGDMIRHGVVMPQDCVPPLVALLMDVAPSIRAFAQDQLNILCEKFREFVERGAVEGLVLAFESAGLTKSEPTLLVPPTDTDPSGCTLGLLYTTCFQRTVESRNRFLQTILDQFKPQARRGTVELQRPVLLLRFLAQLLSVLPFTKEEEPLFLIFQINRIISLASSDVRSCLCPVLGIAEDDDSSATIPDASAPIGDPNAVSAAQVAQAVIWLAALKVHLKTMYNLKDSRCQEFTVTAKATERPLAGQRATAPIDLQPLVPALTEPGPQPLTLARSVIHAVYLRMQQAAHEGPSDFAAAATAPRKAAASARKRATPAASASKPKRRRSTKKRRDVDADEDEQMVLDSDEEAAMDEEDEDTM